MSNTKQEWMLAEEGVMVPINTDNGLTRPYIPKVVYDTSIDPDYGWDFYDGSDKHNSMYATFSEDEVKKIYEILKSHFESIEKLTTRPLFCIDRVPQVGDVLWSVTENITLVSIHRTFTGGEQTNQYYMMGSTVLSRWYWGTIETLRYISRQDGGPVRVDL